MVASWGGGATSRGLSQEEESQDDPNKTVMHLVVSQVRGTPWWSLTDN